MLPVIERRASKARLKLNELERRYGMTTSEFVKYCPTPADFPGPVDDWEEWSYLELVNRLDE